MLLNLLLGIAVGLPAAPPAADTTGLDKLNAYRQAAGLPRVALDEKLSKGCQDHAQYLARNFTQITKQGLRTDDESPTLPGFTEEGKAAGEAAFSGQDRQDATNLIDLWMASLYIRPMLLDPDLHRIGWGRAQDAGKAWFAVLDVQRGRGTGEVVAYPVDGQKGVPLAYPGSELPDPIPEATNKRAGYPITLTFPAKVAVRKVTARLTGDKDKEVPFWLSTPEKPAHPQFQANTICLIAKAPLQPSATYTAAFTGEVNGAPWKQEITFTTLERNAAPQRGATVLERINAYRKTAGLEPVTLDEALSKGCQAHAFYLAKNTDDPATQDLGAHTEDPKLPGYTVAGQKAGKAADISFGIEPLAAVDGWMATLFHRVPILDPDLKRIGFGTAKDAKRGTLSVLDVRSGHGSGEPILYPGDKQKDVPLAYHAGERPDPIPESKTKKAGFPITVMFPRNAVVKDASATLTTDQGKEVPVWLSSPEKTADLDLQRNSVGLIAQEPLRPSTTYTVTISAQVDGAPWKQTWSFTTGKK
jgi:uncharacterized protein YkwD